MAVPRKVIPAAFAPGLDTGKEPRLVSQGFLKLQDIAFVRQGAMGVRTGRSRLHPASTRTEPHVAGFKGKPVAFDQKLYMLEGDDWSSALWQEMDTLELWDVDTGTKLKVGDSDNPYGCEVVECDKVRAWFYSIYNSATSQWELRVETYHIDSGRQIDSEVMTNEEADCPRLCKSPDGDTLIYLYANSSHVVAWGDIDVTDGTITGATATTIDIKDTSSFSAVWVDNTNVVMAGRNAAGTHLTAAVLQPGTGTTDTTSVAVVDVDCVSVWHRTDTTDAVIAYYQGSTENKLYVWAVDEELTSLMSHTLVRTVPTGYVTNVAGCCEDSSTAWIVYTEDGGTDYSEVRKVCCTITAGAVSDDQQIIAKSHLLSQPWWTDNNIFYWVGCSDVHGAWLMGGGDLCGRVRDEAIDSAHAYFVPTVTNPPGDTGRWDTCLRGADSRYSTLLDTDIPMQVQCSRPTSVQTVEAHNGLLIPGSLPLFFDGDECVEQGYLYTPETPTALEGTSGNLSAGTYQLCITYRWRDLSGQLHESSPSGSCSEEVDADDKITWTVSNLCHTRRADVQICLWRTKANGYKFYMLTTLDNDKTSDTQTYADTAADSTLTGNEELYTTGYPAAILENTYPPQHHIQCVHQNRHFAVDDENPGTRVYYSKEFAPNLGIEHSDSLVLTVPPDGGDITALASDMDRLFVFKATKIWVFTGEGLANDGSGMGYQGPLLFSDGVGADSAKLVVNTSAGLMFKGHDQIYGMGKSLALSPVGDAVRYYTDPLSAGVLTFKAAVHKPKDNLVAFLTTEGTALAYNTLYGVWSTWSAHDCTDAAVVDDLLIFKNPDDSIVWYEITGDYRDNTVAITPYIETGFFDFGGLGGVQIVDRVLLHMYARSAHTLNVAFQYDGDPTTWQDTQQFDASSWTTFGSDAWHGAGSDSYADKAYIIEAEVGRDICTSLRLKIWPTNHTGASRPFEIFGLSFIAGVTGRLYLPGGAREA